MVAGWRFVNVWLWLASVCCPESSCCRKPPWSRTQLDCQRACWFARRLLTELVASELVEMAEAARTHPESFGGCGSLNSVGVVSGYDEVVTDAFGQALKCVAGFVPNIDR